MPKLLGINLSPYVRKVLVFAHEAGIELEHDNTVVPMNPSEEFLEINPRGKIPGFVDGDLKMGESGAICAYLDRVAGGTDLYPQDNKDYARALWFQCYADDELVPAVGKIFFNRFVAPNFNMPVDENSIAEGLAMLPPVFSYLNSQLVGRDFLAGNSFSIGDIALLSAIVNFTLSGETLDGEAYPELARYVSLHNTRPSMAAVIAMTGA